MATRGTTPADGILPTDGRGAGLTTAALAGTTNGTPYGWALTDQMTLPADATNIVALDASLLGPIALRADGTVLTWDGSPPPPPGLSNVVAIAAGDVFHLALTAEGRPVAWGGFHVEGVAITTPPVWLTHVVAISAGYDHSVALTSDGYLIPWGANALGVLNAPARSFNPRSFSAGQQTVLVIEENGRPFGWGTDNSGILTFPIALSNAVQVSASPFMHALGLRADGRVLAWGENGVGQATVPPGLTNIVQVCAGPSWSIALRDDGTVRLWGEGGVPWTQPPPDPVRFLSVAAGNNRNFGLTRAPVPRDVFWSTNVPAGSSLNLGRAFIGSDPFEVQWLLNGQPIPGETNATLFLGPAGPELDATYTLRASNAWQTVVSPAMRVAPFGPVEFRWNLTNAETPMLWVRAPGINALRLQESTNLIDWSSLGTWFLAPAGSNFDPGDPFVRNLRFFRWVAP